MRKSLLASCVFILCGPWASWAYAQSKLHTPAEILKIMQESKLAYEIDAGYTTPDSSLADIPVLSNQLFLVEDKDGKCELRQYSLSKEADALLGTAEAAFQKNKQEQARTLYRQLYEMDPTYHHALTLIGDAYYNEGKYDSAKTSFRAAIDRNFVDYNAWWFLADTYRRLQMPDSALHCITVAHLLNVNHQNLRGVLREYWKDAGHAWKEWVLAPEYSLSRSGNGFKISSTQEWLFYAMVKALWKYEPGYSEQMLGSPRAATHLTSTLEEKEALIAYISSQERNDLAGIVEDGYGDELVLYELIARRAPKAILLLPRAEVIRIAEYLWKYH